MNFQPTENGKIWKISITLGGLTKANWRVSSPVVFMLSDPQQLLLKTKEQKAKILLFLFEDAILLHLLEISASNQEEKERT